MHLEKGLGRTAVLEYIAHVCRTGRCSVHIGPVHDDLHLPGFGIILRKYQHGRSLAGP